MQMTITLNSNTKDVTLTIFCKWSDYLNTKLEMHITIY
jgi:hypothetical protein